ncbi:MAG: hypothetical protein BMS9Abin19_1015 [Gammaproteobacteria bacterium]|nr:MAG: hypothetical protein BMS9Abin19_1015 [Gammaproteobacteria bacterium]
MKYSATSSKKNPIIDCANNFLTVKLRKSSDEVILEKPEHLSENIHTAGITIQLKNGRFAYTSVPPELSTRVMQSIRADKLNTLVVQLRKQ